MSASEQNEAAVVARFLARYHADQKGGASLSLDAYLGMFPGHEERIAAEYAALAGAPTATGNDTLSTAESPRSGAARSNPDAALASGQRIAGFELVRPLGRGGMGEVWEARELELERSVALKFVHAHVSGAQARARAQREAVALARLTHPGIVAIHALGTHAELTWISQELVPGGRELSHALAQLCADEPPSDARWRGIAELFRRIAEALSAAHHAGVVHRDLKPSNVLIEPDGQPKVADFGLAVLREQLDPREHGRLLGTVLYMSPEQVSGFRYGIDGRSDVFSLGAMLYEALAQRRPFEPTSASADAQRREVLEAIASEDPAPLAPSGSAVPKKLARIAERCLAKARARRYQTMADVAEDLRRFQAGEPLAVARQSGSGSGGARAGDPAHALVDQRIGGYALVRLLGKGAQGEVWEAEQEETGGRVALKLLPVEGRTQAELDRFQREAHAGARRVHPGLIHVYAAGFEGAVHWIAMELVEGGRTLRDVIQGARERGQRSVVIAPGAGDLSSSHAALPTRYRRVALFFADIAEALEEMHAAGILHRDLKPANVLVTSELAPKVADFGSARLLGERTLYKTGELAGTPRYMSPEQLNPRLFELDARSDVFALGIMLYEALALHHPFEGDDRVVQQKIQEEDPPPLREQVSELPADLAVIAHKCLEKRRADRYASMRAVVEDLRRFLADEPIAARPPSPWQRALKWTRRNPTKSAVALVLALAFVAISGLALVARDNAAQARDQAERADANALLAERGAAEAEEQRRAAEAQKNGVLGLAAFREHAQLVDAARDLWPVDARLIDRLDAWLERARKLVATLSGGEDGYPGHRAMLASIEARAQPRNPDEQRAERESHARIGELAPLEARIASLEYADGVRRGEREPLIVELPAASALGPPGALVRAAWPLVDPDRRRFGEEPKGLALARAAYDSAPEDPKVATTLAWARFANGLDDEAVAAAEAALAAAPSADAAAYRSRLERLARDIARARGEEEPTPLAAALAARAELEATLDARRSWRFADPRDAWWREQLLSLIATIEAFADPGSGLLGTGTSAEHGWGVGRRRAQAERLAFELAEGGAWHRRWMDALAEMRSQPGYPGDLAIQAGLVPIGRDPRSGLWELWHVLSGEEPLRDPATGELVLREESGLVLVLIPAGAFWMGAQRADASARNYDAQAEPDEGPVREVTLDAFFVSKYELTQAQWLRCACSRPSAYEPGKSDVTSLLHPVENVSFDECAALLARFGLVLPTEAQWEYAARAGTDTPWWCGAKADSLAFVANVADAHLRANGGTPSMSYESWSDGHAAHAAVGSYAPNAFGLHDVHGNVWEWCRDWYYVDAHALRSGDGERVDGGSVRRTGRGSGWQQPATTARSSVRGWNDPTGRFADLGLRPSAPIARD